MKPETGEVLLVRVPESTLPDESQVQRAAALTLLKIRELHRLPQSVMGAVDFQSLFDVALLTLKHCIGSTLQTAEGIIE